MRKHNATLALLLTASMLALTGCSRNPVAPDLNAPADPGASSSAAGGHEEDKDPGVVGEGGADGSLHVESMEAGVLTVGRWSLTVHKNSHIEASTISMTVPDLNSMEVMIEVSPASANVFQVPIELVADCSDQQNMVADQNAIFFLNGEWSMADDQTVQAGSLVYKAKVTQLMNAKVGTKVAIVKGGKKN